METVYDLKPISHITIDTRGLPGNRVFYLQATRGHRQTITLILEKSQALALVSSLDELLAELAARFPRPSISGYDQMDMSLREPLEPLFRVGQIGLAYDEKADLVVIIAYKWTAGDDEEGMAFRFWGTREQMLMLRDQALVAAEGGRPACHLCGQLIGPEGHLCPRSNGHGNHPRFSE